MTAESNRKMKLGTRMSKSKSQKSAKKKASLVQQKTAREVTTLGYQVPKLNSATKLKGKVAGWKLKLGGKGANLAQMFKLKLPVPPAFNLSTALCSQYLLRQQLPDTVWQATEAALAGMEKTLDRRFGGEEKPLLVSVRSGAPVSMPGMMDTILNLGLNDQITKALVTRNPELSSFWWDCYQRLVVMFADVVLGLSRDQFDDRIDQIKQENSIPEDELLPANFAEAYVRDCLELISSQGKEFPQDPKQQLKLAIEAVFRSWNTERAIHYREINSIDSGLGTAVNIQAMVFGNLNDRSGTGVVFTRNPSTGEKAIYGEFLMKAQGEDVVAGIRTPVQIAELKPAAPTAYAELLKCLKRLEDFYQDVQDVEFTIEDGRLFILQTRAAKRTAKAYIEHLIQFVKEKRIAKKKALTQLPYAQVDQLLHPTLKPTDQKPLGQGLPASPGAVSGRVALDPQSAIQMSRTGEKVILVRRETSPEDIQGMSAAEGILTATGGMTSHAAVVGRGMGKACVVGCSDLQIKESEMRIEIKGERIEAGSTITINGATGDIYRGVLPTEATSWSASAQKVFGWADAEAEIKVFANADTPDQALLAKDLGAQGVGLCRTEHMFFEAHRLKEFRRLILSTDDQSRSQALSFLESEQTSDFFQMMEAMKSLSLCVRLLDPPLHEFLPLAHDRSAISSLATEMKCPVSELQDRISKLSELNPMLGHRGCRLGVTDPDIYRMQVRALAKAFTKIVEAKCQTELKIMIPLVADVRELEFLLPILKAEFYQVVEKSALAKKQAKRLIKWGTMIELPRACLLTSEMAKHVDFISFGTNDLTQTTFGLSRDDSNKFLPRYKELGIYTTDPFISLDRAGIGQLIRMAIKSARKVNKKIEVGVCGEHGGDPSSIEFFQAEKFQSVSCSPFRVPIARLACGRAAFEN